jgi:hypothetical protein
LLAPPLLVTVPPLVLVEPPVVEKPALPPLPIALPPVCVLLVPPCAPPPPSGLEHANATNNELIVKWGMAVRRIVTAFLKTERRDAGSLRESAAPDLRSWHDR